jgi:hypothetical protein
MQNRIYFFTEFNSGFVVGTGWSSGRISINVKSHFANGTKLNKRIIEEKNSEQIYSVISSAIWLWDSWNVRASFSIVSIRLLK